MSIFSQNPTADVAIPAVAQADSRPSALRAIAIGGLIAGALDITDAFVANQILSASPSPVRVLQYIASGLLGPASYQGGLGTAALGLACHFTIALGAATVYVLASRHLPILVRRPIVCGMAFGIAVMLFMQNVVVPLSAVQTRTGATPLVQIANQVFIHALGIGLPIALAARKWASKP